MKVAILRYGGITKEILEFCTTSRTLDEIAKQFYISENIAMVFLTKLSERGENERMISRENDGLGILRYKTIRSVISSRVVEVFLRREGVSDDIIASVMDSFSNKEDMSPQEAREILDAFSPDSIITGDYWISTMQKSEIQRGLVELLENVNLTKKSIDSILIGLGLTLEEAKREATQILANQGVSRDVIEWILFRMKGPVDLKDPTQIYKDIIDYCSTPRTVRDISRKFNMIESLLSLFLITMVVRKILKIVGRDEEGFDLYQLEGDRLG